jgi:uncharacterized protein (TIGR02118 family)
MPKFRLTVAYNQPPDPDDFFTHYAQVHAPLARALPGLETFEWSKVMPPPSGELPRFALLAELTFASMDAFLAGTGSPEGQAAQADAESFATNGYEMFASELMD